MSVFPTCLPLPLFIVIASGAKQSHQPTLLNLIGREWAVSHNVRNLTCALISAISIEKGKEVRHGKDASLVMPLGVS